MSASSLPGRPTRPPPTPPSRASPPVTNDAAAATAPSPSPPPRPPSSSPPTPSSSGSYPPRPPPVPTMAASTAPTAPAVPAATAAPTVVSLHLPIPPLLRTWHAFALKALHKRACTVTLNLLECSLSFDKAGGGGQRHREFGLAHLAAIEPGGGSGGVTASDREREVSMAFHTPQTAHSDGTVPSTLHVPIGLFDGDDNDSEESSITAGSVAPSSVTAQTQTAASLNAPGPSGVGSAAHVSVYKKLLGFDSRAERDEFCDLVASVRLTGASVGVMGAIPGAALKQLEGNPAVLLFLELDTARAGSISVDVVRRGLQRVAEAELGAQAAAAASVQAADGGPVHPAVSQLTTHMHSCTLSRFVILYGRLLTLFNTPSAAQNLLNGSSVTGAFKHARHTPLSSADFIPVRAPSPPPLLCGEQELISQSRAWLVTAAPAAYSSRGGGGGGGAEGPGEAGSYAGMFAAFSPSNVVAAASAALGFGPAAASSDGGDGTGGGGGSSSTTVRLRGCFFLTNHRLLFVQYAAPEDSSGPGSGSGSGSGAGTMRHVEMNLGSLERLEISTRDDVAAPVLSCYSKDFRLLQVGFDESVQWAESLVRLLSGVAFSRDQSRCFAFSHRDASPTAAAVPPELEGFNLWDPLREYARVGLVDGHGGELEGRGFRVSYANLSYELVPSYPRLLVVPSCISDAQLGAIAKYRSSGRLPAVVWRHPITGASLSRCSQPLSGMRGKREDADEKLIAALRTLNPTTSSLLYLMDARPFKAALGNTILGKGVENVADYPGTEIRFLGIDNIHAIRGSYLKLVELLAGSAAGGAGSGGAGGGSGSAASAQEEAFHAKLAASGWMGYLRLILTSSVRIARVLSEEGASVTVHCSDGWDRTSQICGLVQLMLDPYYRSLRGFAVLIESCWLSFGHQFALRHGHADPNYNDDQRAPIFIQWLDCVWQLWRQLPCAFEFTESALVFILEHVYSCRFGTFLYNNERERHAQNVAMKTVSIWTVLIDPRHAAQFINPCYAPVCGALYPNCSMKKLQVWEGAYMRHDPDARVRAGLGVAERSAQALWRYKKLREKLRSMGMNLDELDPEPGQSSSGAATQVAPIAAPAAAPAAAAPIPPAAQAPPSLPHAATAAAATAAASPPSASAVRPPPARPPAPVPAPTPSITPPPPAASAAASTSPVTPVPSPSSSSAASATAVSPSSAYASAASELPSRPPPSRPAPILPSVAAAAVVTSTSSAAAMTPKSAASPFRPPTITAHGASPSPSPNTPTPPPAAAAAVSNGRAQLHVRADSTGTPSPSSRVRNSDSPVRTPTKKMAELLSKFQ